MGEFSQHDDKLYFGNGSPKESLHSKKRSLAKMQSMWHLNTVTNKPSPRLQHFTGMNCCNFRAKSSHVSCWCNRRPRRKITPLPTNLRGKSAKFTQTFSINKFKRKIALWLSILFFELFSWKCSPIR